MIATVTRRGLGCVFNVKVVQRMLGHASAAMTLDIHAGLFDRDLDTVADRPDEAASRDADSVRTGQPLTVAARSLLSMCLGNLVELYDFAVFGASAPVLALVVTAGQGGLTSVFVVLAASLLVRPLGAVLVGRVSDRVGRRVPFLAMTLLTCTATALEPASYVPGLGRAAAGHDGGCGAAEVADECFQLQDPTRAGRMNQQAGGPERSGWPDRTRQAVRAQATRLEDTIVGQFWARLLEIEFVDRSVALAAKAVVSFFPLLIVAAALSPPGARPSFVEAIAARFGISGQALTVMKQAFTSPDQTRAATGLLGTLLVVAYAVSFTTALQRVYLRAWRRPSGGGVRNKGRGAIWVANVLVLLLLLAAVRRVIVGPPGTVAVLALGVTGSVLSWWWTARLMLRSEVRWRPLLPTALVTGVGSWVYTLAATLWMPRAIAKHYQQFGAFGLALDFVSWFTGMAFLVAGAAVLAPVLAEGNTVLARWLRAGQPSPLEPSAVPSLPAPTRAMRLSDAFGLNAGAGRGEPPA